MERLRSLLALSPAKITSIYVVLSGGYIATSDTLAAHIAPTQMTLTRIQTVKGWVFVALSGLLILGLTRYRERQLEATRTGFDTVNEHLHVIHRVLRHNIRNNLNIVTGYLSLAREAVTDDNVTEYLTEANIAVDEFIEMANKLRLIDEIDPTDPTRESINIVSFIDGELQQALREYPAATVETEMPRTAYVKGGRALRVIIRELIENAIEHNDLPPEKRRINVAVDAGSDVVTVTIADNGPGIPEGEFEALDQGIETALTHCSGAGLWVITWLMRLFEGEISFHRDPDTGTTVQLEFVKASTIDTVAEMVQNEVIGPTTE